MSQTSNYTRSTRSNNQNDHIETVTSSEKPKKKVNSKTPTPATASSRCQDEDAPPRKRSKNKNNHLSNDENEVPPEYNDGDNEENNNQNAEGTDPVPVILSNDVNPVIDKEIAVLHPERNIEMEVSNVDKKNENEETPVSNADKEKGNDRDGNENDQFLSGKSTSDPEGTGRKKKMRVSFIPHICVLTDQKFTDSIEAFSELIDNSITVIYLLLINLKLLRQLQKMMNSWEKR